MIDNKPTTLGALKKSGYTSRSIKDEIRENIFAKQKKLTAFIYKKRLTALPAKT